MKKQAHSCGAAPQDSASLYTAPTHDRLMRESEIQRNPGLHFHCKSIYRTRLESPMFHGVPRRLSQKEVSADHLHILYRTVPADAHLQNHGSLNLLPPSFLGIIRLDSKEHVILGGSGRQLQNPILL